MKMGKAGRCIGDLKVPASLQGSVVTAQIKDALCHRDTVYSDFVVRFIKKPTASVLKSLFNFMIHSSRPIFAYFSDDSVYSDGLGFRCNVDISKCDISHSPALFDFLLKTIPESHREAIRILVDQLRCPFRVYSIDKTAYVQYSHDDPILASGSTLTTLVNNIACELIGLQLSLTRPCTPSGVVAAAAAVGYHVTVEVADHPSGIQFLKHSPHLDYRGNYVPGPNLGILLRAIGRCRGDLPGKGDISLRASWFNHGLLRGMYPRIQNPFIDSLKARFEEAPTGRTRRIISDIVGKMFQYKVDADETYHIPDSSYLERYPGCSLDDLYALQRLPVGHDVSNPTLRKILSVDYGYTY
jgi:hypothetical protein